MPGIFYQPSSRRNFLKSAAIAGAAIVTGCHTTQRQVSLGLPEEVPVHFALLSDIHIPADRKNGFRGFNPWENLKNVVPEVVAAKPQAAIVNGDLARLEGAAADYKEVRDLLQPIASAVPVYLGLGNHDDRKNFKSVFTATNGTPARLADKHVLVIDQGALRFVILDSLLYTNKVAGLLGQAQRAWLAEYLATNSEKPHVLFVHHTLGDKDGDLLDSRRLFELIRPHPQVKAIFYGHSHEWSIGEREHVKLVNIPAIGYNFKDGEPLGWVDAKFDSTGADITLRAFAGNTSDNRKVHQLTWALS
jgi:3',5'-cyclic AMP phosphodiesterase CpdA